MRLSRGSVSSPHAAECLDNCKVAALGSKEWKHLPSAWQRPWIQRAYRPPSSQRQPG